MEYITKKNKVRYYETDQMGFVHHSNYLKYFEMSRIEWFEFLDIKYNELEKKYKQLDGTMFFYKTENLGYSHAYLSNDNSELLVIEVMTDPEFLKSINVVGELTIFRKLRCEVLK